MSGLFESDGEPLEFEAYAFDHASLVAVMQDVEEEMMRLQVSLGERRDDYVRERRRVKNISHPLQKVQGLTKVIDKYNSFKDESLKVILAMENAIKDYKLKSADFLKHFEEEEIDEMMKFVRVMLQGMGETQKVIKLLNKVKNEEDTLLTLWGKEKDNTTLVLVQSVMVGMRVPNALKIAWNKMKAEDILKLQCEEGRAPHSAGSA